MHSLAVPLLALVAAAMPQVVSEEVGSRAAEAEVETDVHSLELDDAGGLDALAFSDPDAWRWVEDEVRGALELHGASDYAPPFRSPRNIALLNDVEFGDFDLTVDAKQTGREYGHRDLCFFFGFQSPSRYYYVHLATTPDRNAHNVFLVDGAARRNLLPPQEEGVDWGTDAWHRVRIERRADAGTIRVFFDDLETPVLEVTDDTFGFGRVGVGSFDDTGRFRDLRVEVEKREGATREPRSTEAFGD